MPLFGFKNISLSFNMPEYPPLICGIDPGQSGGIALIGKDFAEVWPMPATEQDTYALLEGYTCSALLMRVIKKAYIEAVHSFPGQGVHSMFVFGQSYGFLRGILTAMKIPFEEVAPQRWKTAMGLKFTKNDPPRVKKNGSKQLAQQLFPQLAITHATSEALLIAEYGRRLNGHETA